jgi:thiosulfate/3-mercaptopyruvate sulfurtransferase
MVDPVVPPEWLGSRPGLVIADVRWYLDGRSGREAYEKGHIPGAVFVDLDRWLAGPPGNGRGRHPLPEPAVFAEGMSACGIGDGSTVVGYDDAGGVTAARLVWMLRALGVDAALLDGGLQAYGGSLEGGAGPAPAPARFTARPWPSDLLAAVADATSGEHLVIDGRDGPRYRGETESVDPRAGHIPGAVNVPCRENLGPDGRLLPPDVLRRRFEDAGVTPDLPVVSYCGSGVTACHNLLAIEWAGLGRGRLYPGSWSEYSSDPGRPAAIGPEPGG